MKKILIVDDSAFFRREMIQSAEGSDFEMIEAENVDGALDHLKANRDFSLAIIDYNMPVMNGIELTRALRDLAPQLPIIILSAYASNILKQDAKAARVSCWVLKPISSPALHKLITRLIGGTNDGG